MSPREVLAAATTNYAYSFRWHDRAVVAEGAVADLLLLSQDPRRLVAALRAIEAVVLRGEVLSREVLWQDETWSVDEGGREDGGDQSEEPLADADDDRPLPCVLD